MAFRPYFTAGVDEPEWPVWLTVVVALALGALLYRSVTERAVEAPYAGGRLSVPAAWLPATDAAADLALVAVGGRAHGARAAVRTVPRAALFADSTGGGDTLEDAARAWSMSRGRGLTGYRVLALEPAEGPEGRPAQRMTYAYLEEPAGSGGLPTLVRADDVVVEAGVAYQVLTVSAPSDAFDAASGLRRRLVAGWRPAAVAVGTPSPLGAPPVTASLSPAAR